MDSSLLAVAAVGLGAGYLVRSSLIDPKPDCPACNCVCQWKTGTTTESSPSSFPLWLIGSLALVVLAILVSNFALVCKVTLRDTGSGADKEIQINLKGKSGKGVYSGRGLAISG